MTSPRFEHWAAQPGPRGESQPRIPAATVILLRDTDAGLETLMLKRASKLAFAGGLWVFPGGRVDPLDFDPLNPEDHELAAARAAVREAQEEANLIVEIDGLVPLAYWEPPPQTPKRFSTWFFVARAPEGLVTVDGGEITEHEWAQPSRTLERRDLGELELAPPTWVTLRTLAGSETVSQALEAASDSPIEHFCTHATLTDDGGVIAMWHGDAGYDSGDISTPGLRHRLSMYETRWHYERNAPVIELDRDKLK